MLSVGEGSNKKEARRKAASSALKKLGFNLYSEFPKRESEQSSPFSLEVYYNQLKILGHSVFVLFANDILMRKYPNYKIGQLVKMREFLLELLKFDELNQEIRLIVTTLWKERQFVNGESYDSLSDRFKLLLGSMYSGGNYVEVKKLVNLFIRIAIEKRSMMTAMKEGDYKSFLEKFSRDEFQEDPEYKIVEIGGPKHNREFVIEVMIGDQVLGVGVGHNKNQAFQATAFSALKHLGVVPISELQSQ